MLYNIKIKLRELAVKYANGPHTAGWLSLLSFAEASFFPIPPDIFLMYIISAQKKKRWMYYSFITVISSVLGGVFGYFIGVWFFGSLGKFLISFYKLEDSVNLVGIFFEENAFWAVFISGFSPLPYKIFTISAGFFNINLLIFIFASIVSRALRFFSVGYIAKVFGNDIGIFVFRYFNALTLFLVFVVVAFIIIFN